MGRELTEDGPEIKSMKVYLIPKEAPEFTCTMMSTVVGSTLATFTNGCEQNLPATSCHIIDQEGLLLNLVHMVACKISRLHLKRSENCD